eukprot:6430254-Prymnesium_polylepis.2
MAWRTSVRTVLLLANGTAARARRTAYFNCVLEDTGGRHPCSDGAPGRNVDYFTEFCFEQLRIATVWYAFRQLRSSNGARLDRLSSSRSGPSGHACSALRFDLLRALLPRF